jgi:hypothetical protein
MSREEAIAGFREALSIGRNIVVTSNNLIRQAHSSRQDTVAYKKLMDAAWYGQGNSKGKGSIPYVVADFQHRYPELSPFIDRAYGVAERDGPAAFERYLDGLEAMLNMLDPVEPPPKLYPKTRSSEPAVLDLLCDAWDAGERHLNEHTRRRGESELQWAQALEPRLEKLSAAHEKHHGQPLTLSKSDSMRRILHPWLARLQAAERDWKIASDEGGKIPRPNAREVLKNELARLDISQSD